VNKKIGEGVFGEVYSATHDGHSVALKVFLSYFVHRRTRHIFTKYTRCCTGRFRGLREVQVVCVQAGGAQSTRTC